MQIPKLENGLLRASKKFLLTAGVILTFFGLIFLGMELWRTFTGLQEIRWKYIGIACGVIGAGLILVQTLNPLKVFEMAVQLWESRYPGGRRWTDPPPETAPPRSEHLPEIPPRQVRSHHREGDHHGRS